MIENKGLLVISYHIHIAHYILYVHACLHNGPFTFTVNLHDTTNCFPNSVRRFPVECKSIAPHALLFNQGQSFERWSTVYTKKQYYW